MYKLVQLKRCILRPLLTYCHRRSVPGLPARKDHLLIRCFLRGEIIFMSSFPILHWPGLFTFFAFQIYPVKPMYDVSSSIQTQPSGRHWAHETDYVIHCNTTPMRANRIRHFSKSWINQIWRITRRVAILENHYFTKQSQERAHRTRERMKIQQAPLLCSVCPYSESFIVPLFAILSALLAK